MKALTLAAAFAAVTLSLGLASAANANIYELELSQAHTALPAPHGKVEVTQSGVNQLKFVVTLFDGLKLVDTGSHYAFAFALDDAPPSLALAAPSGFTLVKHLGHLDNAPFGGFDYGMACAPPACGPGGTYDGPLTFTISGEGLTLSMLGMANGKYRGEAVRFAADTWAPSGKTGAIGGGALLAPEAQVPGIPEPGTWAMMILGMGMVGAGLRRRRRAAIQAA